MSGFFSQVSAELSAGRDLVLAAIVRQVGSAPRSTGTRFYVAADGSPVGTIGGGRLEAETIEAAKRALVKREAGLLKFRMQGQELAESEMLCGGDVDVHLEPILAGDPLARELFQAAAGLETRGERGLMVTSLSPGPAPTLEGRKALVLPGGQVLGGLAKACDLAALSAGQPGRPLLAESQPGQGADLFLEPIYKRPCVFLMGGGHISLHLAALIKTVGFDLVVGEDRPEFANRARFPMADQIWLADFDNILAGKDLGPQAFVVIITRGHIHDKVVLAQALSTETAYVGMIGSRRKRNIIYKALEDEGFSAEAIGRVHSPVGLDIGAETPEEIAVSIVAELIQVRASLEGRGGKKLPLGV